MKACTKCKVEKDLGEFPFKKSTGKPGSWCKACYRENGRKWRAANPEAVKEGASKYRAANPEATKERDRKYRKAHAEARREYKRKHNKANAEYIRQRNREWRAKNKHKVLSATLSREYGLSFNYYTQLLESQRGVCAICDKPPNKTRLAVDHNHRSGKVRGLLCRPCNTGISHLRDSIYRIENAAFYLGD